MDSCENGGYQQDKLTCQQWRMAMRNDTDESIGFIGLGLMGLPMARNLHNANFSLTVYNRSKEILDELEKEGYKVADSAASLARNSTVVICMVSDTDAVEQVLFGEEGVASGVQSGTLVVDMGTTEATRTKTFAAKLNSIGIQFVDSPVSGGQQGAENASLSFMVGAREESFERLLPIFNTLGEKTTHIGDIGAGQIAKAANQIVVGLTIAAVAEAFALTRNSGISLSKVREALLGGFAQSKILDMHGQRMIDENFTPGGKASTQRKDLHQALLLAEATGTSLPVTKICRALYDDLLAQGHGNLDHSSLFKVY